jgi:hypothetical protein
MLLMLVSFYHFLTQEYWVMSYFITNFFRVIFVYMLYTILTGIIGHNSIDRAMKFTWIILALNFFVFLIYPQSSLYSVTSYGEIRFSSIFYLEPAHYCLNFACISLYVLNRNLVPKKAGVLVVLILVLSKSFSGLLMAAYFIFYLVPRRALYYVVPIGALVFSRIEYISTRFERIAQSTDMSTIHRTLGMLEGLLHVVENKLIFGVGLGQINQYLLYTHPQFKFWFAPVLYDRMGSGINNGLLYLFINFGILGLFFVMFAFRKFERKYVLFLALYMSSISNILDIAFVLPLLVLTVLSQRALAN